MKSSFDIALSSRISSSDSCRGDVTALFWQGSYEAPTEAGDYTWTSQGDTEAVSQSILASTDSTKDFSYSASDDELSFKVEWQGATVMIHMSRN